MTAVVQQQVQKIQEDYDTKADHRAVQLHISQLTNDIEQLQRKVVRIAQIKGSKSENFKKMKTAFDKEDHASKYLKRQKQKLMDGINAQVKMFEDDKQEQIKHVATLVMADYQGKYDYNAFKSLSGKVTSIEETARQDFLAPQLFFDFAEPMITARTAAVKSEKTAALAF